jgi:hypothetical protein
MASHTLYDRRGRTRVSADFLLHAAHTEIASVPVVASRAWAIKLGPVSEACIGLVALLCSFRRRGSVARCITAFTAKNSSKNVGQENGAW